MHSRRPITRGEKDKRLVEALAAQVVYIGDSHASKLSGWIYTNLSKLAEKSRAIVTHSLARDTAARSAGGLNCPGAIH